MELRSNPEKCLARNMELTKYYEKYVQGVNRQLSKSIQAFGVQSMFEVLLTVKKLQSMNLFARTVIILNRKTIYVIQE